MLLPLLGAAGTLLVGRHPRTQRTISLAVLTAVLAVSVVLLLPTDAIGPTAVSVGGWPVPLGIVLVVDRLSALMLVVASTVALGVLWFAVGQGSADGEETPLSIFHPTFLVLIAGVSNAFLAGDLFNLYVGFEILLMASYVLLTLGGSAPRVRAGITYVVVSLTSSLIFLAAIALIYASTGTVTMAQLAIRLGELPDGMQLLLQSMLLIAFCIKAAVFPLSAWLPDSYPTAPAPVTAVFAGLLTKVGVYAIIRTQTLLFPGGGLDDLLMWAGAGHDGHRHPRCGRADRHPPDAVVHPGQPHRLHGVRHRPGDGGGAGGRDLLRGPPHRHPDHAVPRRRADRAAGRLDVGEPARGAGEALTAARGAVLRAGDEPRRHPAVLRVHRQAGPAAGRCRRRQSAGPHARRGRRDHQPADPAGGGPRVDPGLLAAREPGAAGRHRGCGCERRGRRGARAGAGRRRRHRRREAGPTVRQAAWSAAWQRHEAVATAGTSPRPPGRRRCGRCDRCPA